MALHLFLNRTLVIELSEFYDQLLILGLSAKKFKKSSSLSPMI
jgi:hypothetical protein